MLTLKQANDYKNYLDGKIEQGIKPPMPDHVDYHYVLIWEAKVKEAREKKWIQ